MAAIYQRARPVTFDQVVGQEHVKDVLVAAVARGLIGHAYLFSGPRGVGKTTTARLLAMAVNCEADDPAARPCGECASCVAVQTGSHPDVMELDAASNNSVDDVRAIKERLGLSSLRGGTRVWVLDEAHMLSRSAANALLKTLEEPPPGLLFVLATTEPEKLPPTILSRCQHFRFRRLTDDEISSKLRRLCEAAGVAAEPAALELVAKAAEGAMRDAESMLERLLVAGGDVTAADAEDALGLPPRERLAALADAMVAGSLAEALPMAGDLYQAGFAPRTIAEQLGRTLRDELRSRLDAKDGSTDKLVLLIDAMDEESERFGRRDDLYGLEVALIKSHAAAAGLRSTADVATGHPPSPPSATPVQPATSTPERAEPSGGESPPAPGGQLSWHAVRTAAPPQLKAFLQPAEVGVEGGRVTLTYGDSWRFHYEQVAARRGELEQLVRAVGGEGFEVEIVGPGDGSARRQVRPKRAGKPDTERPPTASRSTAPGRPGAPGGASGQSTAVEARDDAPPAGVPGDPSPQAAEELPPDFWEEVRAEAEAVADQHEEAPVTGTPFAQLQELFPGRVVGFVPSTRLDPDADAEGSASRDPGAEDEQRYDDDGQERLTFGATAQPTETE